MRVRLLLAALGAASVSFTMPAAAQTTLNGAVQFNDEHAFTKAMVKFEELVKKYYGKPVNFVLHKNSELGLEKQYFEYMAQAEAFALLEKLTRHATQEKYQLRLKYGVGDVVIWDNASLLHSATLTEPQDPRTLWRITVKEKGRP